MHDKKSCNVMILAYASKVVKRAVNREDIAEGNMGIAFGCAKGAMSEQFLDKADVGAVFEEMSGKTVA
jgi:hypothetical protein